MTEAAGKTSRPWVVVAFALVAAWILFLGLFGPRRPLGALPVPRLEAPAPPQSTDYRWTFSDLRDAPVDFASYKGKPVFLNIWATWCGPCVAELPSIANLAANPRLKDVAFLCVSTDDSAETVRSFLKDKAWPMTVVRAGDTPRVFATEGIPATFLIAPDGRIAAAEVGSAQWDDPSVVDFLEKLAKPAEDPGPSPEAARP